MDSEPLTYLKTIQSSAAVLLSERLGVLMVQQRDDLTHIRDAAHHLIALRENAHQDAGVLVSHETRDYLTTVMGFAEMLLEGADGGLNVMQIERLNAIRANVKLTLVWLEDLLAIDS